MMLMVRFLLQIKKISEQKNNEVELDDHMDEEVVEVAKVENSVLEEACNMETDDDEISQHISSSVSIDNGGLETSSGKKQQESGSNQNAVLPEVCCTRVQLLFLSFFVH